MPANAPMTREQFLELYPLPADIGKFGKVHEGLWTCDMEAPVEKLWPQISNTSILNRLAGLGEMTLEEKNGKIFGNTVNMGITLAWEEQPWQWEYGKATIIERRYSKGFLRFNRVVYAIEPTANGKSRFYAHMILTPRGIRGFFLVPIVMNFLHSHILHAAKTIDSYVVRQQKIILGAKRIVLTPQAEARLKEIRENLLKANQPVNLVDKIIQYVRTTPDEEMDRIRVKKLAQEWHMDERTLLGTFLHATRAGLFKLTWDVICPHCRGVRQELESLIKVPKRGNCEVCQTDFDANTLNAVEVVFHVHPSIREIEKKIYCAAEPATKAHIKLQKSLAPGKELSLSTFLGKGRYRLRLGGKNIYNLLDVEGDGKETQVRWSDAMADQNLKTGYFPTVVLENYSSEPQMYILEDNEQDRNALRPADLFTFQNFRDLFAAECVSTDVKLEIGVQTILFTDLVGSTKFYEQEGDAVAFAAVRKHFQKTYEEVIKHDGAIVKTIGDAVMASYVKPVDALKSAIEMQEYFNGHNPDTNLRLRITLHTGPCLAVNINEQLDYFGSTVNLTAKIQAIADAGQIGFTQAVHEDKEAVALLQQKGYFAQEIDFEQKWSKKIIPVYRIEVS